METLICPTCGCSLVRLGISKEKATKHRYGGEEYLFCCKGCADVFAAESYARIWVTGDHAAAWVWSLLASIPSLNLTPSTSFDNW